MLGLGIVLLALAVGVPAAAQWEVELAQQIQDEADCEMAFLSQVVRREVEGRILTMAKVHCLDRRTYDAYRSDESDPFEFKECEPPDAKSC
jgi:hypothetical protein